MKYHRTSNKTQPILLFVLLLAVFGMAAAEQANAAQPTSSKDKEKLAYVRIFSAKIPNELDKPLDELEAIARQYGTEEVAMFQKSVGPEKQVDRWIIRQGSEPHAYPPGLTVKARSHLAKQKGLGALQIRGRGRATTTLPEQSARLEWVLPESVRSPLLCDIYNNDKRVATNTIHERLSPSKKQRWPNVIRIDFPQKNWSIIQVFEYLDEEPEGPSSVQKEAGQDLPAEQIGAKSADKGDMESSAASSSDCSIFKDDNVSFSASSTAIPSLDLGTGGWVPAGSPVQINFSVGVGANVLSSVSGKFEYCWKGGSDATLTAGSGKGNLSMDFGAEMTAEGRVKVDLGWYDADFTFDIPYTPNFDLRCKDSTSFNSYLLNTTATVSDSIDEQELYSVSVGGIPSVADVSVGASAAMSLTGTMGADSITTSDGTSFTNERQSCPVTPDQNGYETTLSYNEDLTMTVTVTFYPWICAGIDVWIYEWEYCVSAFAVPVDIVSGAYPLSFSEDELDYEATYELMIRRTGRGTTEPRPGLYDSNTPWEEDVNAIPYTGYYPCYDSVTQRWYWTYVEYVLEYWVLDGEYAGSANPYRVNMNDDYPFHSLRAVFFRPKASCLYPRNGVYDVEPNNVVLSWLPGERAVNGHDVYFGTDFNDVNNANNSDPCGPTEIYRGNQALAETHYIPPEDLETCETYYWRIDEVNDSGIPWKGDVWWFTIAGCCASDPNPVDEATDVARDVVLSWSAGGHAADVNGHDVYLGTDLYEVMYADTSDTSGIYRGRDEVIKWVDPCDANNVRYTYSPPENLDLLTTYYWRIHEVNDDYVGPAPWWTWWGNVWSFTVEGKAKNPYPPDGAEDVTANVVLSWTPGIGAADMNGHDVYFGTDFNDVNDANAFDTTGIYRDAQDSNSYSPTEIPLDLVTTYYWRLDGVNDTNVWKGDIWRFTTADYLVVDDFNSYPNDIALSFVWDDGFINNTCAEIFLETDQNFSRNGSSMQYTYNNARGGSPDTPRYSEAEADIADLIVSSDWTIHDVKTLVLYFYGQSGNDANEMMYVALEDADGNIAVVEYDGDMNDIKIEDWQEWNIRLQDFNDINDVNLMNVAKVYIGFGIRGNTTEPDGSGSGTVWFDDIRLYPSRCVPEKMQPVADLTDDCAVDFDDVKIMARDWLDSDSEVIVEEPCADLLVEYLFDTNLDDTSSNGYHAIGVNEPNVHDGILTLDGNDFVDIPLEGGNNPFDGSTDFSIVIEFRTSGPGVLISSADPCEPNDPNNHSMALFVHYLSEKNYQTVIHGNNSLGGAGAKDSALDDQWHQVVTTYDANTNTHRVYLDGKVGWDDVFNPNIPDIDDDTVRIGGSLDTEFPGPNVAGNFVGDINSIRIYNCTLSHGQVLSISGEDLGPYYVQLDSPANLVPKDPPDPWYDPNNPDIVNFKDFAVLAEHWLEEFLWPEEE
jgi:hypothetical protein